MTTTTQNKLRSDLTGLPSKMRHLPVDERGYPVPVFVAWVDGKPDHRISDPQFLMRAIREKLCWICGGVLGTFKAFTVGPMCLVTGTSSEPPSHWDCAKWSVCNYPFLSKPQMVRREDRLPEGRRAPAGIFLERNPGVVAVVVFRGCRVFRDDAGLPLIHMPIEGECESIHWYRLGQPATRTEVEHSVETGLPALVELARKQGIDAVLELENKTRQFRRLLPAE